MSEHPTTLEQYEKTILGTFLTPEARALEKFPEIQPAHFTKSEHRQIMATIKAMLSEKTPINLLTVADRMKAQAVYIAGLTNEAIPGGDVGFYVNEVLDAYAVRVLKARIDSAKAALNEGAKPADIQKKLAEEIRDLTPAKGQSFADFLTEKLEAESQREPGELLGPSLQRFKELSKKLDGIQPGLYIIAAEPNIGKSTFCANILVDFIQANPDAAGLYVSLDDPRGTIASNMLTNLTFQNYLNFTSDRIDSENYVQVNALKKRIDKSKPDLVRAFSKATETAKEWATAGRLDIRDIEEVSTSGKLENIIRAASERNKKLLVVIDALFNLHVEEQSASGIREANIARANILKELSDVYKIPIFTTAEITKGNSGNDAKPRDSANPPRMSAIMETGKFAYNANLVCMLYPLHFDEFVGAEKKASLVLDIVKNKISPTKEKFYLSFTKASQCMEPIPTPDKPDQPEKKAEPAKPRAGGA